MQEEEKDDVLYVRSSDSAATIARKLSRIGEPPRVVTLESEPTEEVLSALDGLFSENQDIRLIVYEILEGIKDLQFLGQLPHLRHLEFEVPTIECVSGLEKHPGLVSIHLGRHTSRRVAKQMISGLRCHAHSLQRLTLVSVTGVVEGLDDGFRKLQRLVVFRNKLRDWTWLRRFDSVSKLGIRDQPCLDLKEVAGLSRLRVVSIWDIQGQNDLSGLWGSRTLEYAQLGIIRKVKELNGIDRCESLRGLYVDRAPQLAELDRLSALPSLEQAKFVEVRRPSTASVTELCQCRNLRQLAVPPRWGKRIIDRLRELLPDCDMDRWTMWDTS